MLPQWIKRFGFNEIDLEPNTPGIYAWYSKLEAGVADWRKNVDEVTGIDSGELNIKRLLLLHSIKYNPPEYKIEARTSFELQWQGELKAQLANSFDKYLKSDDAESWQIKDKEELEDIKKLQKPLKAERSRANLIEILNECTPFFSAPIYIGRSDDVSRRLKEHTDLIRRFARVVSADPSKRDDIVEHIKTNKSNFAARVTALGFSPEQLEVFVFDFGVLLSDGYSTDELVNLSHTVEWLLNRWHRPIAGRI